MTNLTASPYASFDRSAFYQTFRHGTALVNGIRLHYVLGGAGDPVVLLHGFPMTWYHWRKIMPALAQNYTVLAPDLRGLGDSSRPNTGYDTRTLAQDIHELVQQLGFEQIFLVGHDWGGPVAYAYAVAHPEAVRRLAILEVMLPGFGQGTTGVIENTGQAPWHFTFQQLPNLPEALVAGRERIYLNWFFENFSYDPAATTPETVDEYLRTYSEPGAMHAAFEIYRAMPIDAAQNQKAARTKLKMPVLALGGERVNKDGPLQSLRAVAENVRGEVIPQCGHFIAEEQPEYLTKRLIKFFNEERNS